MCLELTVGVLLVLSSVTAQLYQSPCPNTFRYETDRNGELHGIVGVYSFDENVELNVELSVGNHVSNYNGQIQLSTPKSQVIDTIRNRGPIQYKVLFPRWENVPPKVTRITVNGQEVCSGPSLQFDGWLSVITKVNLQHRFMKVAPLDFQGGTFNTNNVIRKNPFLRRNQIGTKDYDGPFLSGNDGRNVQTGFFGRDDGNSNARRDFDDIPNVISTTTAISTTASTTQKPPLVNDLLFSENPFLNPRASAIPAAPPTSEAPPRARTAEPPASSPRASEVCGNPVVPNPLVFNGKGVPRGAFPWLAAMFASTGTGVEYKCCGTLVSTRHVVTAAHCVTLPRSTNKISVEKLLFILGKLNIQNLLIGDGEKMVGADDIAIHPDYRPLNADADIAVVVLTQNIQFTNYIRPICLWSGSDDIDSVVGQKGKVVGWGRDEQNNAMTAEPKQTTIPIVSQEQCLRSAEVFTYFTSKRTFCAGERDDSGPCNGDSGSGFVMKRDNRWFLRGIVSLSSYDSNKQSCDLSNYVVFTDVTKFQSWLLPLIVT